MLALGLSDLLAERDAPEWRYARIRILTTGTGRQLRHKRNRNLPSEVA